MSCDHWKRKSIHPSIQPYIYQSISVPIATRRIIIICGNQMWRDRDATSSLGGNNHFHKLLSTLAKRLSATRNCPPHPSVVPPAHLPTCPPACLPAHLTIDQFCQSSAILITESGATFAFAFSSSSFFSSSQSVNCGN